MVGSVPPHHTQTLHIQTRTKHHIPPYHLPRLFHLLIQRRIPDQPRRTHHLPTRLIQPRHNSHYRPLHHIRQIRDAVETHPQRPIVHYFNECEAWMLVHGCDKLGGAGAGAGAALVWWTGG